MIVSANGVCKSYGSDVVLQDVELKIEENDRIGLIGVNGAGKSTLLNLLTGRELPDEGEISVSNQATIGFLRQNSGLSSENTIWEEMLSVFSDTIAIQHAMRKLEQELSHTQPDSEAYSRLSKEYAVQSELFEKRDGYLIEVKIKTILNGMGFGSMDTSKSISTMSGGEKTRLAMAKLLLESPDLLILDEPTNHLDFKTLMWLESYLSEYKGALLLVSHDRYFLDKLVTSVCEVEQHKLTRYKGNYTKFAMLKAEQRKRQQKEYEIQQKQIADMEDYIARNLVRATTSKMAKSRRNALERMERVEKPAGEEKSALLEFTYEREPVKDVLDVQDLALAVGEGEKRRVLCRHIQLHVFRGEKIAIIGANGIGKSTFLKAIQNLIPVEEGTVLWGRNVSTAYYEQENKGLHPEKTALDELWDRYPRMTEQSVRSVLGAVLLSGEDVFKQVGVLSGGERAKLSFAILMLQHANTLLLDEPTNHLDLASKEVLEEALTEFEGTLLMVSHDRYMLNKVPHKILEFSEDGVRLYQGGFDAYLEQKEREKQRLLEEQQKIRAAAPKEASSHRSRDQRSQEVKQRQHLKQLEAQIQEGEEKIAALEEEMTKEEVARDYQLMTEKCTQLEELRALVNRLTDEWLECSEA